MIIKFNPNHGRAAASPSTTTAARAVADGITPDAIRAVASWNGRESGQANYRSARRRLSQQAGALYALAREMEAGVDLRQAA